MFGSMELMGGMMAASMMTWVFAAMAGLTFLAPVLIYVVARWRIYREGEPLDPHLGFKTVASYFRVLALQILFAALFLLLYGLLEEKRTQEDLLRMAGGFGVPAGIVYGLSVMALARTNMAESPTVGRMFNGLNLAQTGLVAFFALIFAFVLLFQKDVPDEVNKLAWSLVAVYVSAALTLGILYVREMGARSPVPPPRRPAASPPPPDTGYPPPAA